MMKFTFRKVILSGALLLVLGNLAFAQVKIGANPAAIGTNSALEIEATNGNKFSIDKNNGQVTIQDGTQGADKVLTSDAEGNASWKGLSEVKVPTTVFLGSSTEPALVTASGSAAVGSRAPIVPAAGYASGWNPTLKVWVVPVAGYYKTEFTARFSTSTVAADGSVIMLLHTKISPSVNEPYTLNAPGTKTLTETAYYAAGDQIYGYMWYSSSGTGHIYGSAMNITYMP
jgi:hypothetical protein